MVRIDRDVEQPMEGSIFVDVSNVAYAHFISLAIVVRRLGRPKSATMAVVVELLREDLCCDTHPAR